MSAYGNGAECAALQYLKKKWWILLIKSSKQYALVPNLIRTNYQPSFWPVKTSIKSKAMQWSQFTAILGLNNSHF